MKICEFCSKSIEDDQYPSHVADHIAEMIEIRGLMNEIADDLAQKVSNISRWGGWVVYLLETLEPKAADPASYETMIATLRDALDHRIQYRYW